MKKLIKKWLGIDSIQEQLCGFHDIKYNLERKLKLQNRFIETLTEFAMMQGFEIDKDGEAVIRVSICNNDYIDPEEQQEAEMSYFCIYHGDYEIEEYFPTLEEALKRNDYRERNGKAMGLIFKTYNKL